MSLRVLDYSGSHAPSVAPLHSTPNPPHLPHYPHPYLFIPPPPHSLSSYLPLNLMTKYVFDFTEGDRGSVSRRWPRRGASTASSRGAPRRSSSHRPRTGDQGHRRGRAVSGSAGERGCAVCGRKEPDPGTRSHLADAADATWPARAAHPRLRAPRHHYIVRGPRDATARSPGSARTATAIKSSCGSSSTWPAPTPIRNCIW